MLRAFFIGKKDMNLDIQENIPILKRNKAQRGLLAASIFLFFIAIVIFIGSEGSSSDSKATTKIDYASMSLTSLLEQANTNYERGDFEQSIPYLDEAAKRGNPRAQYSLGYMYQNGEGVDKNINRAKEYYLLSAKQGHKKAKAALKGMEK